MRYLSIWEVFELHDRIISSTGVSRGLHDLKALESAGNQPRQTFDQKDLYPDIVTKASALCFSYPSRWRYDILRAMDYLRLAGVEYDARMDDAIDVLLKKRRADGKWPVQARHPGQTHFIMEKTGKPSRCNTLRALRVLNYFGVNGYG